MSLDLPLIWGLLIATAIFIYAALDGFDLGVGMLFPFTRTAKERDTVMNSIAPVWDGNETWLVLGGGGLFAVFPLAYSVLLTAFYMPVILMLTALIFRGVAFEFRFRSEKSQHIWDMAFFGGSLVAALCQGVMLGAFIQGVAVEGRAYAGGWFDWLTPFSLFTGLSVAAGYALLGAAWLIMKTDGALQARHRRLALMLTAPVFAAIIIISLWTPQMSEEIAARWFSGVNALLLSPLPLLSAGLGAAILWTLAKGKDYAPFLLTIALFLLCFIGFGVSQYPYIVPREFTLWEAAGPDSSLAFMLVGAVILLPIILSYTGYAYWVFRGKVREGEGYH